MMKSEFIKLTGFEPTEHEYEAVEEQYISFDGNVEAFCKTFVEENRALPFYKARFNEIERLEGSILELDKQLSAEFEVRTELEKTVAAYKKFAKYVQEHMEPVYAAENRTTREMVVSIRELLREPVSAEFKSIYKLCNFDSLE